MRIQSILRRLQAQPGFIYGNVTWSGTHARPGLQVTIKPRKGSKPACSGCGKKGRAYDKLAERRFAFVPLWGLMVYLAYSMRRVDCKRCGVTVEMVPWATGKSPTTHALTWFLASWAKVLSWTEVGRRFHMSWDTVFRCVEQAVRWGLAHRSLDGIQSIGVDELAWKKNHKYLTLVYQIDTGCRRLLWIGRDRTKQSFNAFFDAVGEVRAKSIRFIASDMWKAFLSVVKNRAPGAVHVLDRFHVAQLLSKAVDNVRRDEVRALRKSGKRAVLTKTRWILLKNRANLTRNQSLRLRDLLRVNLRTVRAYLLKEQLQRFWKYRSAPWAGRFLDEWTRLAMRSRLPPFQKFAKTLRRHRELLLNWFRARNAFLLGATEGFNNKARITTRKAYGFRTYEHAEIALYHSLGNLPEPDWLTHKFY